MTKRSRFIPLALSMAISLLFSVTSFAEPQKPATYLPLQSGFEQSFELGNLSGLYGRIAFTASIDGFDRILELDIDARKVRILIDGPGNNSYPDWSPDGKLLSFTSDRDGNKEIYLARYDGEEQRRLTANPAIDDNAAWAPDGKDLVYYSENNSTTNLFRVPLEGGRPIQITAFAAGKNSTPRWSPDGTLLAYSTDRFWPGWDICIWNVSTKSEDCVLSGTKAFCRPAWSPDGRSLAYSAGTFDQLNIESYNLKNHSTTSQSNLVGREYDAVWSPTGKQIAFVSELEKKDTFNIYITRDGAAPAPLLRSRHSMRYLSWSGVSTMELESARVREVTAGQQSTEHK